MKRPAERALLLRALLLVPPALLPGCASSEPLDMSLGTASATADVVVLGDGFVRFEGRRVPLERCVLELRLRLRAMAESDRASFRIVLEVARDAGPDATTDVERLLDQLQIMGVPQVRCL